MDLYTFRGLEQMLSSQSDGNRVFTVVYWGFTVLMLIALIRAGFLFRHMRDPARFYSVALVMGIFLMLYIPKLLFNVTQLLSDVTQLGIRLFGGTNPPSVNYFLIPGAVAGIVLFLGFGMGMLRGRTNIKIFRECIEIPHLPDAFSGLKIVQLSDLHLAGFYNHPGYISEVVKQVNQLQPDLILFTGDMVHNFSEEMDPFIEILNTLKAPLGKYAVLGNHDYGHYFRWETKAEEEANLEQVKVKIGNAGFDLLLNEHRILALNGHSIQLIGVENWGKPPFPQIGNLDRALAGSDPDQVKILMSHDPSHWDLMVKGREDIILTLSGHTHGMQFGIEIGNFRWSPSQWNYKQWAGLYRENGQYLYVNRGLGYTGYPGRVGIRPEITLLELNCSAAQPVSEGP